MKRRPLLKKKIARLLIATLLMSSFYGCSNTTVPTETSEPEVEAIENNESNSQEPTANSSLEKENVVTAENPNITKDGASVSFSPFDLQEERTVSITQTEAPALTFDEEITEDYLLEVYDIHVPDQEEFIDLIEIRLDYDEDFIEASADESRSTFAMYFNEENNTWETVDYSVDTANNQVIVTTSHLSKYGVFTVKNENTRLAYIGRVNSYKKIVDSTMAQEIITEAINRPATPSEKAINLGMNVTNDWLGLSGFLLTTSNPVYSTEFLEGLGGVFNGLGIAAAAVQVAVDFQSGNDVALYGNLSKNMLNLVVSNWGTSALQLSFAGVFAIDYSLNKFATAAWDGRKEIWYDAYHLHYKEKMQLEPRKWYSKFYWIWQDSLKEKDPNYLKDQINQAIESNIQAFWQNESEMAFYQGEVMDNGATGGGGLSEDLKREITDAKRAELVKSLQPIFNQLEKKITYYLRDEYRKKLEATKRELNQVVRVTIEENIGDGMTPKYGKYIVKFAPLSDQAKESTWTGRLSDEGKIQTKFTILGHMQSGGPNTIELYTPDADLSVDSPEKIVTFKITGPELKITLGDYPPLEALVGQWPGTFYFEQVTVPDPKPKTDDSNTESEEESCDSFDIDLDEIFADLKAQEGKKTPTTFSIAQINDQRGYLWFGDDPSDLDEDEKLYFNYQYGRMAINQSQEVFNLSVGLVAEYIEDGKIKISGPLSVTGMNGTLDIDLIYEGVR